MIDALTLGIIIGSAFGAVGSSIGWSRSLEKRDANIEHLTTCTRTIDMMRDRLECPQCGVLCDPRVGLPAQDVCACDLACRVCAGYAATGAR